MTFLEFIITEAHPDEIKFHKDLFLPPSAREDLGHFWIKLPRQLRMSGHWVNDRSYKHEYTIITKDDLKANYAFEWAYLHGRLIKVGFRVTHLDPKFDVIYIVSQDGKIVTSWLNSKEDTHRTLDRSKYASAWTT